MNSQQSRKIIVAGSMAAVVGIGVLTFALRSHPVAPVAKASTPPPVARTPDAAPTAADSAAASPAASPAVDRVAAAPAPVAQTPDAPATVAHNDGVLAKSGDRATPPVVQHKLTRNRHLAKADTGAVTTNDTGTPAASTANTSEKPATDPAAQPVAPTKNPDELANTPATSSSPADEQKAGTSTEFAPPEGQTPPK